MSHAFIVIVSATAAMLAFCSATQGYMLCRNKLWETITLLLISLMVFRPGLFWDQIYLPTVNFNASQLEQIASNLPNKAQLHIKVRGEDFDNDSIYEKVIVLPLDDNIGSTHRLANSGLELRLEDEIIYVDNIGFDSHAQKLALILIKKLFQFRRLQIDQEKSTSILLPYGFLPLFSLDNDNDNLQRKKFYRQKHHDFVIF